VELYEEGKAKHWWKFKSFFASNLDVSENLMRWWHPYNFMALCDNLLGGCKNLVQAMNI